MAVTRSWIRDTTSTTGTGSLTLDGSPPTGRGNFRAYADAEEVVYIVTDGSDYEKIKGSMSYGTGAGGKDELTITTVLATLVSGTYDDTSPTAISWGAGSKSVYADFDPGTAVDTANNLSDVTASTARTNLGLGTMALEAAADYLPVAGGTMTGALTLNGAPTNALHAATKAYIDGLAAAGNLTLATGDQVLWGGSSVPSGFAIKTGTSYSDRMPLIVTTAGGTKATGGSWGGSVSVTVNGHTLTVAEMPAHTHSFTVRYSSDTYDATGADNAVSSINASTGSSQSYTSTSQGSGSSHNHSASGTVSSSWRPKNRTFAVIEKS